MLLFESKMNKTLDNNSKGKWREIDVIIDGRWKIIVTARVSLAVCFFFQINTFFSIFEASSERSEATKSILFRVY